MNVEGITMDHYDGQFLGNSRGSIVLSVECLSDMKFSIGDASERVQSGYGSRNYF